MYPARKEPEISGVHHIALGVKNLETVRSYYQDTLEFNQVFAEFPEREHKPLEALLRMPHVVFSGAILHQQAGGILLELVHMVNPFPRPIRRDFTFGDIGINKITIPVPDLDSFYTDQRGQLNFCSSPKHTKVPAWGNYHFVYCRDPEDNLIEFVSTEDIKVEHRYGGVHWIGVAVSDLERSIGFYEKKLGFKQIITSHDHFSGLVDEVTGKKDTEVRSCLLANSNNGGMVELFEVLNPRGRSIPFSANWGDFGYLQLCLNAKEIHKIAADFQKEDIEIISPPMNADDERAPTFMYFRDPDGILLEVMDFNT